MKQLFISYLYRLRHDLTFKITLLIGAGMALFMSLLYFGLGKALETPMINGQMMLYSSLSPAQNFGLAIPINLITFTVMEFTQGSIRNKIIAGNSKSKIYTSMFLNGLVFAFVLLTVYALLSFGLGIALAIPDAFDKDGVFQFSKCFDPNGSVGTGVGTAHYFLLKYIVIAVFVYIFLVAFTIFFASLFRNIGPSIPVVILVIVLAYLAGSVIAALSGNNETVIWTMRVIDPFFGLSAGETEVVGMVFTPEGEPYFLYNSIITTETFVSGILSNIVYTAIFFFGGLLIFKKRDVK